MAEKRKPYGMTTPCDNCPFRTNVRPYLTKGRVREIERGLVGGEFYCHKTTDTDRLNEEEDFGNNILDESGGQEDDGGESDGDEPPPCSKRRGGGSPC